MKKILSMVAVMLLSVVGLNAAGTAAGTTVKNSATLSFNVGGVPQNVVPSNEDSFVVDKKIDFLLENKDAEQIDVIPASTNQITTWEIINEGNMDQNFTFTVAQLTSGETIYADADTKDSEALTVEYSTDGGTTWIAILSATPLEIAVDTTVKVRIKTDIDSTRVDGDVMNISLTAVAVDKDGNAEVKSTTADDKDVVEIVFAEAVSLTGEAKENGTFIAWGGYIVKAPKLDLTKTSCVLTDPVNLTTNPKRIPGATVLYILDINNSSTTSDATDVNLSDTLEATLDISTLANLKHHDGVAAACSCSDGTAYTGGTAFTNTGAGQEVKITGLTITKAKHNCVSFEVEIF
jgi:hypothetical protein